MNERIFEIDGFKFSFEPFYLGKNILFIDIKIYKFCNEISEEEKKLRFILNTNLFEDPRWTAFVQDHKIDQRLIELIKKTYDFTFGEKAAFA